MLSDHFDNTCLCLEFQIYLLQISQGLKHILSLKQNKNEKIFSKYKKIKMCKPVTRQLLIILIYSSKSLSVKHQGILGSAQL